MLKNFIALNTASKSEVERYLSDFDNLLNTKQFPKVSIKETTHYHKEMTTVDFLEKGRELIRQLLQVRKYEHVGELKQGNTSGVLFCIEVDRSGIREENLTFHETFKSVPTRDDVLEVIKGMDCGYDDDYCKFTYYQVQN